MNIHNNSTLIYTPDSQLRNPSSSNVFSLLFAFLRSAFNAIAKAFSGKQPTTQDYQGRVQLERNQTAPRVNALLNPPRETAPTPVTKKPNPKPVSKKDPSDLATTKIKRINREIKKIKNNEYKKEKINTLPAFEKAILKHSKSKASNAALLEKLEELEVSIVIRQVLFLMKESTQILKDAQKALDSSDNVGLDFEVVKTDLQAEYEALEPILELELDDFKGAKEIRLDYLKALQNYFKKIEEIQTLQEKKAVDSPKKSNRRKDKNPINCITPELKKYMADLARLQ